MTLAKKHIQKMEMLYSNDIANIKTKVYDTYQDMKHDTSPILELLPLTTVDTIFYCKAHYDIGKIAVLNFASYKKPGGDFEQGASTQEESLCHASLLFNVLQRQKDYYQYNNLHKNRGMYMNRLLYSVNIPFFLNEKIAYCDVITCAAPNRSILLNYHSFTENENIAALRERMTLIKYAAEQHNVTTLILGAYGCGVCKQKPNIVGKNFLHIFQKSSIAKIIFGIPKGPNFKIFKELLSAH